MTRQLSLLAVVAACGGPSTPVSAPHAGGTEVAFTVTADHTAWLVPVRVNDQELRFQLDTGASASAITPAACAKVKAACAGGTESGAAAGGEMDIPTTKVRLALGGGAAATYELGVMDLPRSGDPPIEGVLGRDVFGDRVLTLDFDRGRMSLGAAATGAGGVSFVEVLDSLIQIPVTIDGVTVKAVIDVGASSTVLNPLAAARLADPAAPAPGGAAAAVGADGHPISASSRIARSLAAAGRSVTSPQVYVADLPVFATLGLGAEPAMILGLDVLARGTVVIDYGRHTVTLSP